MLQCTNKDPEFLKSVLTDDETWVYGYNPEIKVQSSQWKEPSFPRSKKRTVLEQGEGDAG